MVERLCFMKTKSLSCQNFAMCHFEKAFTGFKCIFHLWKKNIYGKITFKGKRENQLIAASSSLHRMIDWEKAPIIFLANNQGNREISNEEYISVLKEERRVRFETTEDKFSV